MCLGRSILALSLALALAQPAVALSPPSATRNRGYGLAQDLRLALRGLLAKRNQEPPRQLVLAAQKPYCVPGGQTTSPAIPGPPDGTGEYFMDAQAGRRLTSAQTLRQVHEQTLLDTALPPLRMVH